MFESKTKAWQDLVNESTVWGKPYKIVIEKFKKLELPPLKTSNKTVTSEKSKYLEILTHLFPKTKDYIKINKFKKSNHIEVDDQMITNIIKKN